MKYLKSFVILVVLLLTVSFPIYSVKAAGPPDQFCASEGGANTTMIRSVSNQTTQTFKPTVTNISRITVKIKGDGVGLLGFGIEKNDKILAWNNEGPVAEANGDNQTMTFTFNDLEVLVNQEYSLVPRISTNNYTLYWYYDYDCYDRGAAFIGAEERDYDFDFAIYGFNADMPPNSALDLDEDEDQPAVIDGDEQNQNNDTPVASDVTTPSANQVATNSASPNQTSSATGIVQQTKSLVNQIPFVSDEEGNTNSYAWFVFGGASLAIVIAIGVFIYLRAKKKKQNIT